MKKDLFVTLNYDDCEYDVTIIAINNIDNIAYKFHYL